MITYEVKNITPENATIQLYGLESGQTYYLSLNEEVVGSFQTEEVPQEELPYPLYNKFNKRENGLYNESELLADFNINELAGGILPEIEDGALKVLFKKDKFGANGEGLVFFSQLPEAVDEVYVKYDVFFPEGFEFRWTGKLPGLQGGTFYGVGRKPQGEEGWYASISWYAWDNVDPHFRTYVAHHSQRQTLELGGGNETSNEDWPDQYELKSHKEWNIETGKWYEIEQRVKVSEGIYQVWLDSELVYSGSYFEFGQNNSVSIDKFDFSCFMGGASQDFAPNKDQYLLIDNIIVSPYPARAQRRY